MHTILRLCAMAVALALADTVLSLLLPSGTIRNYVRFVLDTLGLLMLAAEVLPFLQQDIPSAQLFFPAVSPAPTETFTEQNRYLQDFQRYLNSLFPTTAPPP